MLEIEVREKRGEYLKRDDVMDFEKGIFLIIKSKLMALGDIVSSELPGGNKKLQRSIIRKHSIEILEELANIDRWPGSEKLKSKRSKK